MSIPQVENVSKFPVPVKVYQTPYVPGIVPHVVVGWSEFVTVEKLYPATVAPHPMAMAPVHKSFAGGGGGDVTQTLNVCV